jgi:hypothetical protein
MIWSEPGVGLPAEALAIREKTLWRDHEVLPLALCGCPTFQL